MNEASRARGWSLWGAWRAVLLLALAALAAVYAAVLLRYFGFPYGDLGWAIDHIVWNAWQITQGQPVYTDPQLGNPGAFMYTPGFTFLLVPLVALFGPELWTARLVNVIGALLLFVLVTRETARRVRDRRLVWFAPGLLFLLGSVNFSALIMVQPEVWAVAFALLALNAARRLGESGGGLVAAVLLACAAVATKQTMLAYVLVAAVTLLAFGRARLALLYAGGVALLLGAATAWGQWATDGWFLRYVLLGAHQEMLWPQLPQVLGFMAQQILPYLLVILAALVWAPRGAPAGGRLVALLRDPWAVALLLGLALQPIVMLKRGNMPNHFLGITMLLIPLFLAAIDALLPRLRERAAPAAVLALLCLAWTGWRLGQDMPPLWRNLDHYPERVAVMQRLEQIVQESHGSVWCPMSIALAYRNGAPVVAPALILAEFLPAMPDVTAPVLAQLDRAEFETILVPNAFRDLLPEDEFRPRFNAHYRMVEIVGMGVPMGTFTPVTVLRRSE